MQHTGLARCPFPTCLSSQAPFTHGETPTLFFRDPSSQSQWRTNMVMALYIAILNLEPSNALQFCQSDLRGLQYVFRIQLAIQNQDSWPCLIQQFSGIPAPLYAAHWRIRLNVGTEVLGNRLNQPLRRVAER